MSFSNEFPSARGVHNLDSAATGLLPQSVIDAVSQYHVRSCANAGRSAYLRSVEVTDQIEATREIVAKYFGTSSSNIVFTPGATHAICWIAMGLGLTAGDRVLVTRADHHANILPWLRLRDRYGVIVEWADCDEYGRIDTEDFEAKVKGCKIASFSGASNVTGAIQPIKELSQIAHQAGALSLVDSAQLAPHTQIKFDRIGCDFMACSGHKMLSPKGVGLLIAGKAGQDAIEPVIVGGGSIDNLSEKGYIMKSFPAGFESGTQCVEGIIGLAEAIKWFNSKGHSNVFSHETALSEKILDCLRKHDVKIFHPKYSTPTISFSSKAMVPHIISRQLDRNFNVLVRSGHMCALPFTRNIPGNVTGLVRVSVGPWNNDDDIKAFELGIDSVLTK